jgi:hypothetical protein
MFEQKWQNSLFATQKQENDWVYTPNQGALRCAPPAPLSRLAGYALAVNRTRGWMRLGLGLALPVSRRSPDCQSRGSEDASGVARRRRCPAR